MSVYLGTPGRLIELKCPASQSIPADDPFTFERTLGGKVKAQVSRPLRRRQWSVGVVTATPRDVGALAAFAGGEWGYGPFIWVSADAPVTNLLTPAQASCDPSTLYTGGVTATGPLNLGADGWAGRSFTNATPATPFYFGNDLVPALPGQPVTVSAYLVGVNAAVRIRWVDAAGAFISFSTGTAQGVAGVATRCTVTATPPANAVQAHVQAINTAQAARPAMTWTDTLFDWSDGQGCLKAVVSGLDRQVVLALRTPGYGRYADASFTITEVG
ncbi:hypothetical protein QFZ30_002471 [Arthrobacter pascens]|uniref:hypothetical protein n=1 Tax=Arthrobacter pascens TaxID=1677 RepID=UPI0027904CF8|nr:hypothetical protein [Arthrobacter pascens]MDQ0679089.1 hypothetical protein [Arthrobacter pascens]